MISSVPKQYFFSASQEEISKHETENKDNTASPEILMHIDSENTVIPNTVRKKNSSESKKRTPKMKKKSKNEKKNRDCKNECCSECCDSCLMCFAVFCDCLGC